MAEWIPGFDPTEGDWIPGDGPLWGGSDGGSDDGSGGGLSSRTIVLAGAGLFLVLFAAKL